MIKINLWNELRINKSSLKIKIEEQGILFSINKNNHMLFLSKIIEIAVYKKDHMSFDTLILRISTDNEIYEIPYEIKYSAYLKIDEHFVIPKFDIISIIPEFRDIINFLQRNIQEMSFHWLDELGIIDNNNIVINFKR